MQRVSTYQDFSEIVSNERVALVYFTASWCGPCSSFHPVVEKLSTSFEKLLKLVKVDVEDVPQAAGAYEIRSIPTLMLLRNGQVLGATVGAQSYEKVSNWLMGH